MLAHAKSPVIIIHGEDVRIVLLKPNSVELQSPHRADGAEEIIEFMTIKGQEHNFWPGVFNCKELVALGIKHAKAGASGK